jgi:pSer/pThr/pTyr-binding forkhead associated (FHA) protein
MPPKLILKYGDKVIKEFELTKSLLIGRESGNIVIKNPAVSSKHARIEVGDNAFFVFDLNSTNGTYVNNLPVTKHELQDGDIITIGKHQIIFSNPDAMLGSDFFGDDSGGQTVVLDKGGLRKDEPPPTPTKLGETVTARSPASRLPQVELIFTTESGKPSSYKLTKDTTLIGSGATADVKVSGMFVGKISAVLNLSDAGLVLVPEGGLSKAKINGKSVSGKTPLKNGDKITIGKSVFEVKM